MRIVKPLIFTALFFLVLSSMAKAQMTSGATTVPPSAPIEPPSSAPASSTANKPLSAPLPAGSATVIRKEKTTPSPQIHEMALSDDPLPVLQPETFFTTAKASERYLQIVDRGGWPTIGAPVQAGAKGASIITLRRRLAAEDEMVQDLTKPVWDKELTAAVKRFQFRLGLKQTGVVAGATLRELDVPASVRFRQLASTAQRLAAVDNYDNPFTSYRTTEATRFRAFLSRVAVALQVTKTQTYNRWKATNACKASALELQQAAREAREAISADAEAPDAGD